MGVCSWVDPRDLSRLGVVLFLILSFLAASPHYGSPTTSSLSSTLGLGNTFPVLSQGTDFNIAASSPSAIDINQTAMSTITLTTVNGFNGRVNLTANSPYGLICGHITPPSITGSGQAIISCSAESANQYTLVVSATNGSITRTSAATFNFHDFSIYASSTTGAPTNSLSSIISVTPLNGFSAPISLRAIPPSGLTCGAITPNSVPTPGNATIECTSSEVGTYTLTIEGTDGLLSHSRSATFLVKNIPDFSIVVTSPGSSAAGQNSTATITVNELNHFDSFVNLTDTIPEGLKCQPIVPTDIAGPESATVSCSSSNAATYDLIVTGSSGSLSHSGTAIFGFVDFSITTISPKPSSLGVLAASEIIISSWNGFVGSVNLADATPDGLTCNALSQTIIMNSGTASISCSASVAGTYVLWISATSGGLTHLAKVDFTFVDTSPNFTIIAPASLSFSGGSTVKSSVTVAPENGFSLQVDLSRIVSPPDGLSITLDPTRILYGSGTSTITLTSSKPGSYTLTITGTSRQIAHNTTVQVTVISQPMPDFIIAAIPPSLTVQPGDSVTSTIWISPVSGFGGTVTLLTTISPSGPIATLSSLSIVNGAGNSNLTINVGNDVAVGSYTVTIDATSGSTIHSKQIVVEVSPAPSPNAPAPSTILGLSPIAFYGVVAGPIIILMAGLSLILRKRKPGRFSSAKSNLSQLCLRALKLPV